MPLDSTSESTLDLRTLSYLSHVDDNLLCPICHSPLINPVNTRCRHTFCAVCIAEALECRSKCPVDRKPLTSDDVSAAPIMIANLVNDLVVLCPNSELGCPTSCTRYLIGGHLKEDCAFVAVKCVGCDEDVLRKDAGTDCLHKIVECGFCGTKVRRIDMGDHETLCPQLTAECTHCESEFPRPEIKNHEAVCEEAIVPCGSSQVGCPWVGPRKELPEHTALCAFTLLRPVLQAHADRLAMLELENKTLRKKIDILLPPRAPTEASSSTVFDDQTIHLLTEQEHIRTDIERLTATLGELETKQSMQFMNETLRTNEELAGMRAAINGIRMQIHWLLTTKLYNGAQGGVSAGGSSNGTGSAQSRNAVDLPAGVRRASDSPGDRVKL